MSKEQGLALFEAALLAALLLPAALSCLFCFDVIANSLRLERIVQQAALTARLKPFRLGSGNQSYFLSLADRSSSTADAAAAEFHQRLDEEADRLEDAVQSLLGFTRHCGADCRKLYRVEVRFAEVSIDPASGRAWRIVCHDWSSASLQCRNTAALLGFRYGCFTDNTAPAGRFYRLRGNLPGAAAPHSLLAAHMDREVDQGATPHPYAVPAALAGALQLQDYGYSELRPDDSAKPINFLRKTVIFGVHVELELPYGRFGSRLSRLAKHFTLSRWSLAPLRQDL